MNMIPKNLTKILMLHLAFWVGSVCLAAPEPGIYVVGNFSTDVKIGKEDLSNLYLGYTRRLPDGESVVVTTLSDRNPTTALFFKLALERTVSEMKSRWSYMVFTGKGNPPQVFGNESDLLEYLERTPNAIGFIQNPPSSKKLKTVLHLE